MSSLNRRHFLQLAASSLAITGLTERYIEAHGNRYGKALAQSTPRKLALLVGINQYDLNAWSNLEGCVNDVEMQKELLINRFGFNSVDIVSLVDEEASRENICKHSGGLSCERY